MSNKKDDKIEKEINECQKDENKKVEEEVLEKQEEVFEEESVDTKASVKKEKKGIFKKNAKEIEELQLQVNSLKDALLRNQAELQNYKRRKDEEVSKMLKYKDEELIREFLVILDNFERAIMMDDNDLTDEVSKFLEGFKLIYTNTINILDKFEVKEIDAMGVEFDPDYHHAVLTEHDQNKPAGVVLEVLQKGYMYKDRVIRPAMVKVNE